MSIEIASEMVLGLAETLGNIVRREKMYSQAVKGNFYNKEEIEYKAKLLRIGVNGIAAELIDLGQAKLIIKTIALNRKV